VTKGATGVTTGLLLLALLLLLLLVLLLLPPSLPLTRPPLASPTAAAMATTAALLSICFTVRRRGVFSPSPLPLLLSELGRRGTSCKPPGVTVPPADSAAAGRGSPATAAPLPDTSARSLPLLLWAASASTDGGCTNCCCCWGQGAAALPCCCSCWCPRDGR
jgi:hypothetical protein